MSAFDASMASLLFRVIRRSVGELFGAGKNEEDITTDGHIL